MNLNQHNILSLTYEEYCDIAVELSKIDKDLIDDELIKHPAIVLYYNGLLNYVKKRLGMIELSLDVWKSEFETNNKSDKKISVAAMESLVMSQPKYSELKTEYINVEYIYNLLRSICASLEHKRDMLVQLSANKRAESKVYS